LAALVLRGPLVVVAPLVHQIVASGAVTAQWVGLSMGMTLFCFAAGAALVPRMSRHFSAVALIRLSLTLCVVGTLLRSLDATLEFVAGSVVIGTAIGVLNVVLPGYAASLSGGAHSGASAITFGLNVGAIVSVLLVTAIGGYVDDWRWLLGVPLVFVVCALALPVTRRRPTTDPGALTRRVSMRDLQGWRSLLLVAAFMGAQASAYYVFLTWTSYALVREGVSATVAGLVVAGNQVGQVIVAFTVAVALGRHGGRHPLVYAVCIPVGMLGGLLMLAEASWAVLMAGFLLGVGHSGALSMAFYLIVQRSSEAAVTHLVSVVVHMVGYLLAGFAPSLIGVAAESRAFLELLCITNVVLGGVLLALLVALRGLPNVGTVDPAPAVPGSSPDRREL
jgi:CP family cyanate transporter-like MFS transporter